MSVMALSSQCWQWRYQGDIGRGVMSLSSLADDSANKATLAVVQCRYQVLLAMALSSQYWL
jgi:hypothetical protein